MSLVDPTYRLCSTRNVPPQQTGWTGGDGAKSATQMDLGEALELREELVKEHARKDEGVFELASTLSFSGFSLTCCLMPALAIQKPPHPVNLVVGLPYSTLVLPRIVSRIRCSQVS
ncbi:hypothetical protein PENFLA_c014G09604 [Penicillium flavigenum]|uniref:DUF4246 domain-containing protein n=1 Tax=Penicillium flavigenum TaxID=254877 RepID=A0A1V6T5K1_9EURO|nr:hypothetical protein PENFLA_c014G09604 [Penicillium flavigenum]